MSDSNMESKEREGADMPEWHRDVENAGSQMDELGVGFDGRYYWYEEYRYELLSDALSYAKLDRSRPTYRVGPFKQRKRMEPKRPTDEEQRLMATLAITYDGKQYRYDAYRYDEFIDAINYAKLKR